MVFAAFLFQIMKTSVVGLEHGLGGLGGFTRIFCSGCLKSMQIRLIRVPITLKKTVVQLLLICGSDGATSSHPVTLR